MSGRGGGAAGEGRAQGGGSAKGSGEAQSHLGSGPVRLGQPQCRRRGLAEVLALVLESDECLAVVHLAGLSGVRARWAVKPGRHQNLPDLSVWAPHVLGIQGLEHITQRWWPRVEATRAHAADVRTERPVAACTLRAQKNAEVGRRPARIRSQTVCANGVGNIRAAGFEADTGDRERMEAVRLGWAVLGGRPRGRHL